MHFAIVLISFIYLLFVIYFPNFVLYLILDIIYGSLG